MKKRCAWAGEKAHMVAYHDEEWGVPVHDDHLHFEMITLEGAQAGLSWDTILKKRAGYKELFADFDPEKVAQFDEAKQAELLLNPAIVRKRLKVASTTLNARAFLAIQKEFGSFDAYIWGFVGGQPIVNSPKTMSDIPGKTDLSDQISKDLLKRGFKFVGSTIVYAYLQAAGLVNDHTVDCFRYKEG